MTMDDIENQFQWNLFQYADVREIERHYICHLNKNKPVRATVTSMTPMTLEIIIVLISMARRPMLNGNHHIL